MARWKLMVNHYLKVDGNRWEQAEIDRTTGKQVRRQYDVPRLFEILEPTDWTVRNPDGSGDIVVTNGGTCEPRDVKFYGDPTPDMEPLDDEAKAISAKLAPKWKFAATDGDTRSYADRQMDQMHAQMAEIQAAAVQPMGNALQMMAEMMKQNQEILKLLVPNTRR